jgi:pimeloyl-ACP methyl ester carboxylesterase
MAPSRRIRSFDGTRLFVQEEGQGPPVVFCDGVGCSGYIWRYLRAALRPHHRLVFWHYRGHGRSGPPEHPDAVGIPALRADLAAVMAACGIERAALLGHSMGVQVALEHALHAPQQVQALVLLCGGPGRPLDTVHGSARLGRTFMAVAAAMRRCPQLAQRLWAAVLRHPLAHALARRVEMNAPLVLPEDLQPYFDGLSSMDVDLFVRVLARAQAHSVADRLHQVRAPTLIVAGANDTLSPVHLSQQMHALIPRAQLLVVPEGSHVAPIEAPERVSPAVRAFLRDAYAPALVSAPP